MLRVLIFFGIIFLLDGKSIFNKRLPKLNSKIVGGTPTTIEEHPYQLSLQAGFHICGASIISSRRALTAAHCTDRRKAQELSVRAGSSYHNTGGDLLKVTSICQHPKYNAWTVDNDASVLILTTEISYGLTKQPIELLSTELEVPVGLYGTVTGWGAIYSTGPVSNVLLRIDVPRVSDAKCIDAYGAENITTNMMCFGFPQGEKDACQGDSGGPLVFAGVQLGIVSWGEGCAQPNKPGVYAKIATLRNHIDNCGSFN